MNTPNPLVPQGSLLQSKGKSNVRIAFFAIAAIHVLFIGGLLMQGCKKSDDKPIAVEDTNTLALPPMTNELPPLADPNLAPAPDTNLAVPTPAPTPVPVDVAPVPVVTPVIPTESREYVVAKGDSFSTIAKKMGVSVSAIQQANPGVDSTKLQIGQKLQIPASGSVATTSAPASADNGGSTMYVVKSGDVLEKIAKNNGTTVKAIMSLNNLKTTTIKVGQKLKLPAKAQPVESPTYVTPLPANP